METKYRLIVGEVGNERGHVISSTAKTSRGTRIALGKALAKYKGDGWGRVEVNYSPPDPTQWQRLS